jgi:hypothetical protein
VPTSTLAASSTSSRRDVARTSCNGILRCLVGVRLV